MNSVTLLNSTQVNLALKRLARQLVENHDDFHNTVFLGLQPRGIQFAERLVREVEQIIGKPVNFGKIDITFHRDDFRRGEEPLKANRTEINFLIENRQVILIDDVLYTGRSIRAALDAMLSFGRPEKVELCVLVDRRFSRHLPVQPDYVGRQVDSIQSEKVTVKWSETDGTDEVILFTSKTANDSTIG
ncbi:MAG: bifunctional pyr operon transcriptional regulator/uracil phosphoribosyltransferase PyrR [Bacteroidota bacterium]